MKKRKIHSIEYIAMLAFISVLLLSLAGVIDIPKEVLVGYLSEHPLEGMVAVAVVMFIATVCAPIAVLPLVPIIAPLLGPFLTGFACWVGWTIGAVIAFYIARYGGRPLMAHFVRLESLEKYEAKIPHEAHFALILALRIVIPVDLLSYALGLFSSVSLRVYTTASALGIMWFSFAFAYLGYAGATGDTVLFIGYGVASAIIFGCALWYTFRAMKRTESSEK
jgi:uncharacterized membrane protein YdjX (TVP38/TMEM64 family)